MKLAYTRNGKEYSVESVDLTETAIGYLLQYGWAQSLQDSIAGREKKVRDEIAAQVAEGEISEMADDEINESVAAEIDGTLLKRSDAIINGTIRERGVGETRDPLRSVANDMLRKALAKAGKKVPKEKFAELVSELLADETKRAKVQAELERRNASELDVEI